MFILFVLLTFVFAVDFPVQDNDNVDFYYCEGLMQHFADDPTVSELLKGLNVYHGSITLFNRNNGANLTLEYFPPRFAGAVFPDVAFNEKTQRKEVKWDNSAILTPDTYNESLWIKETKVSTLNGILTRKWLAWADTYNASHPAYYLFHIWGDKFMGKKLYSKADNCLDFCWNAFQAIVDIGGTLDYTQKVSRDYANLFTTRYDLADYEKEHDQIINFYTHFQYHGGNILEILLQLAFMPSNKYVFMFGNYYRIDFKIPPASLEYAFTPMPGQNSFPHPIQHPKMKGMH